MKSRSNESTDHNQSTNTNPSADATTQEQSDSDSDFDDDDDDDENGEQHILLPPNGLSVPQSLLSGMSNFAYRSELLPLQWYSVTTILFAIISFFVLINPCHFVA